MIPIRLAGPAVEPVPLAQMRDYLRLDGTDEDELVAGLIQAARLLVEAHTRLVLVEQTWRLTLDAYPSRRAIRAPLAPLLGVEGVRVFDAGGGATPLPPEHFRLEAGCDPAHIVFASDAPAPGRPWGGIEIDLRAGFGPDPHDVPSSLVQAVRMLAAHWFEHRGDGGGPDFGMPSEIAALLAPYRRARLV